MTKNRKSQVPETLLLSGWYALTREIPNPGLTKIRDDFISLSYLPQKTALLSITHG